ncbi:hypothetical protein BWI15_31050 [Kribbella sp. ALI-6-A]|uniref:hypothetical protein n=1 Tax=Kribbella sp. ALI-6-A TaxID=1933817 RepID=UPI00097C2240|nr:hypothetical protein [Kribbella sp. ALI-6-A]ONI67551.1 hypothetical protein BWI15_31050 [Kribbella sp. ALI-6-A]
MSWKRTTGQDDSSTTPAEQADGAASGEPVIYPSLIRDREYVDEQGVRWRMRRGELRWNRIERLMSDAGVRVLKVDRDDVSDIAADDRSGLLATIRPYLKGKAEETDGYTDFTVAEFKDDRHRSLLVVEETC